MARVVLDMSEYWVESYYEPYSSDVETCDIPDELLAAEKAAYAAWRESMRAIYERAGRKWGGD